MGVTVFFFISGYIITKLLIDEMQANQGLNLRSFYIRRLLRLYPALLFMIVLFFSYLHYANKAFNSHEVLASIFYYENYYNFEHPHSTSNACKILWSLAVEEHFYLIFPLIFLALFKKPKALVATLVLLLIIPLAFRYWGSMQYYYSADMIERYTYTLTHTRFDSIIYGCLASVLIYLLSAKAYLKLLANKLVIIASLGTLLGCLLFRDPLFRSTIRYSIQGAALFFLVPALINTPGYLRAKQLFANSVMLFVGKMSYAIYLMHMIAIEAMGYFKDQIRPAVYYLAVTLLTAALALFVYYFIEKPFMGLRQRFKTKHYTSPRDKAAINAISVQL